MLRELGQFIDQLNIIFWLIILLSTWMWTLISIAYLTQYRESSGLAQHYQKMWLKLQYKGRDNDSSHGCLNNLFTQYMHSYLNTISAIACVLPLLGLLGTVTGMTQAFRVMSEITLNQQFFSAGIANALLTTLAGLVTALSGVFFHHHLQHRAMKFSLSFSQSLIRN
ncbi:TonB system transport protein [Moritella viscosa]|uniref:MotA/TolQ/ExbB proton channel family protein n=1 Tax=Moritella viscosa TaxID=80854 RepID=UPI000912409D|nr:MotA/TolQ/ExbB proton channel family protein [Moritella viscosa]SGZ10820.1 TonB system transport protein [Moritella viscosa]